MKSKTKIFFKVFSAHFDIINKTPLFVSTNKQEGTTFLKKYVSEQNSKILFPIRYTSNFLENKLTKFFCVLVKFEGEDKKTILESREILREEKFYVYGLKKRLDLEEIFVQVFLDFKDNYTKIIKIKNKIVLQQSEKIECILTKNKDDCDRLYSKMRYLLRKHKISGFLFLGDVPDKPRKNKIELIQKLVNFTGLSHYQFKRNSTRP